MILKLLLKICSAHHKRGEEVVEFNLSPIDYEKYKHIDFTYRGKKITFVSDHWVKIDKHYYREINSSEGYIYISTLTYRLK